MIPFSREILEGDSIDLSKRYFYFSHAFQPEQTTSLLGLQYEDHYLFLMELLRILPEDIQIYCRDYPLHYWPNSLPRNIEKWKSVSEGGRVFFAPQDISVRTLIQNSIGVALVNGSAGYEALLNLKPVIYGGTPDYANLPGTVHIDQLIQDGRECFPDWLVSANDQLLKYSVSPSSILEKITKNSFAGWVSLTETLTKEELVKNKTLVLNVLIWLDKLVSGI